jgi:hypothetical protein
MDEEKIQIGSKIVGLNEKLTPEKEELVYAYLMEVLTGGLYPNKFDVIREYVQNSYDALIDWKNQYGYTDEMRISIDINWPSITIYDNGTGMNLEKIKQYRYIGFSQKEMGKTVGFQGIGKLAGITAADRLIVTTSPFGVGEKYKLVFDAGKMLDYVRELRENRENVTIKKLILDHTDITMEKEDENLHYTFVELNNLKDDSKSLSNETELIDYLGKTVPVSFNPKFGYGGQIEEKLRSFVSDYDWVNLLVNGKQVVKPYREDIKPPEFLPVFGDKKMLAYAWFCQNKEKGQLLGNDVGLVFRYKNFRIGSNYLPRDTIWKNNAHVAFYFYGEIHVCDTNVLPTASRDDFKQNKARKLLYEYCEIISKTLNQEARVESDQRRAYHYIDKGEEVVERIKTEIEEKKVPNELVNKRISELVRASEDIKKRIKKLPPKDEKAKVKAGEVIKKSEKLLQKINEPVTKKEDRRTYQITDKLSLSQESSKVYDVIMKALKDFFIHDEESFERILKKIHSYLEREFKKD